MKRIALLLASLLLAFSTLAGMSAFSMHSDMSMEEVGGFGAECLEHCLSLATPIATVVTSLPFTLSVFVVVVAFLFSDGQPRISPFASIRQRWRDGIGTFLLHQQLSTVILRN